MDRPNVLLVYTDQQRWDALGLDGNDQIHTPNMNRIGGGGRQLRPVLRPGARLHAEPGSYEDDDRAWVKRKAPGELGDVSRARRRRTQSGST